MKIFQVIQKPQKRGAELFAIQLSEELIRLGHEVILISVFEGIEALSFSGRQINLDRPIQRRLWDWKGWKTFAELVKKEKPDIIQANAGDTLKFTVLSRLFFGWKTPLVFRNASQMSRYFTNPLIKSCNRFLLTQVEGIASVSLNSQEDLFTFFKPRRTKLKVIPIGVNKKNETIGENGRRNKELVHIGGFTFEKNHAELLDIFHRLLKVDSDFQLILIGDGPLKSQIEDQVKTMGMEDKVDFLGNVSQPFSHISKNAILLLPSKIEGLPAVILEAMVHHIPVIAYGVGGISEVLKTGETGWCIPPNDFQAFIQAIQEVQTMSEEAKQIILDQAHHLVCTHYSLPQVSLQFEQFYKSLLNQN
ncbi:glycosyltransferase [Algoriphagus confluentis]|uniref:N-acetyl-alpha-D-glucosaminyl L-malate synthase BshA n=1 Tax=Algoriphagus confluentis TaxID=1697556 RepID=A0ABQ6PQP4_9BACT|nr:N-acetyl-alpha-D-glucosaminyl L-malate synthase BshA [Algoriphagus confluentis]